ncbi:DUF4044 domain-containing protein [Aerococcaceae bacterium zg-ZJ1578]|nr:MULTISPECIES: DUF4044 domain-containing protein [unclassified Facklamia]MBK0347353.1 DUF4044 domain-containing protein [Aerococcaceae bacterium zg-1578]MBR7927030.1 DUF4044 domain-containing protein [Aerococcaceae bacterium zg-ZUI334]MBS4461881.1 DUF4044 domain-containing protein [Aerococcaceae bacterium zg-B36]QQD66398.1 DUF4044 domain-containing protein [Aerococcaceae bacterium zg-252]NEW63585.1 DUF4044 domain-containing protein [Facklamia sp. 252]
MSKKKKKKLTRMEHIVRFTAILMVITMLASLILSLYFSLQSFF